jgi:hypothetical protein
MFLIHRQVFRCPVDTHAGSKHEELDIVFQTHIQDFPATHYIHIVVLWVTVIRKSSGQMENSINIVATEYPLKGTDVRYISYAGSEPAVIQMYWFVVNQADYIVAITQ